MIIEGKQVTKRVMGIEKGIEREVISTERVWYENQKAFLLLFPL